jgi:hypothetical protein
MPPGLAAGIITGKTDVVSVPSGGWVYEKEFYVLSGKL